MKLYVWGIGLKFGLLRDRVIFVRDIAGFIDNSKKYSEYLGKKVYQPEEVLKLEYDAIVVANSSTYQIYKQCLNLGIDLSKVIFIYKNCDIQYINSNFELMEAVLGRKYTSFLKEKYHIVDSPSVDEMNNIIIKKYSKESLYKDDYIRVRTFLNVAEEIKKNNIPGEVAEFGVFRGDFASIINKAFPEKKLYLFDTFDGFDESEFKREKNQVICNESFNNALKNTNVDTVLKRMESPESVIIKKGKFPESLKGLEENFSFVSLDVDLEESTYEGLKYFYPRLNIGGYIFIHDYNCGFLNAVQHAVKRYETEYNYKIAKVPLCDYNGTLVITKI